MRTITETVYNFGELSEQAKQNAIDALRHVNIDVGWDMLILTEWKAKLAKLGYGDANIESSGFCSQGDGASFTSKEIDLARLLERSKLVLPEVEKNLELMHGSIVRTPSLYVHANTIDCSIDVWDFQDELPKGYEKLEQWIMNDARELSNAIYSELSNMYFELIDDDAVIEHINSAGIEFNESGSPKFNA